MHETDFYRRLADEWEREMQRFTAEGNQAAAEHARRERDNYLKMFQAACGAKQ
ncbi:MAG: hypothetical protein Q4B82_09155 [Alysiella sp.]|uniref:hypothetical protein n=1 Tax=Alysiella sp. TaxID=1872483 RepID=UPI0026DBBE3C|nr:hypothetical protein [Alysiella sp.]MDO4434728.1 hypothetical protein [Alysiella sp.]